MTQPASNENQGLPEQNATQTWRSAPPPQLPQPAVSNLTPQQTPGYQLMAPGASFQIRSVPELASLPQTAVRYDRLWRAPNYQVWRPIIALLFGGVVFFVAQVVALIAAMIIDAATQRVPLQRALDNLQVGKLDVTPAFFIANNVSLGLLILVSMLASIWFYRQPARWIHSVAGRLRWSWLGRCLMLFLPAFLVLHATVWALNKEPLQVTADTWVLIAGIVLTTGFQVAGEEYFFRGMLQRAFSSFFKNPKVGFAVGAVLSSAAFMAAHGAGDSYLNVYYFSFALVAVWLTWRTGGLEAAIIMHLVNNMLSLSMIPFMDISGMFDRQAGAANPLQLGVNMVPILIGCGLVEWQVRKQEVIAVGPRIES